MFILAKWYDRVTAVAQSSANDDNGLYSLFVCGIKVPNHRSVGPFANVTIASADEMIAGLEAAHLSRRS